MNRLTLLLMVFALAALCFASASAAPRLSLPESTFNFGYVPQNAKITHGFWLHSTGEDTLKIIKIIPG